MIPLPFKHLFTTLRHCPRCGRNTPKNTPDCQHCHALSDQEVQGLIDQDARHSDAHSRLGTTMLIIAAVLIGLFVWGFSRG